MFKMDLFADKLTNLLNERNMTRVGLSKLLNVAPQTVSNYCNVSNPTAPSIETLYTISKILNVSADYLLGLSDIMETNTIIKFERNSLNTLIPLFKSVYLKDNAMFGEYVSMINEAPNISPHHFAIYSKHDFDTFRCNDILLVSVTNTEFQNNHYYLIDIKGQSYLVKVKIDDDEIKLLAPSHISTNEKYSIIGQVVGKITKSIYAN